MNTPNQFDDRAKEWDQNTVRTELSRVFAETIQKTVPLASEMELLEFGCGTGSVSMQLVTLVRSIQMVDTSTGMLDVVRQKIEQNGIRNMEPFCGDIFDLDLGANRLDLIYALMVFHHIQDLGRLLDKFHTLLKPGGSLCIGDLEPEDGSFHKGETGVHRGFDTSSLKETIEAKGFEAADASPMYLIKKPDTEGTFREYPVFFLNARRR